MYMTATCTRRVFVHFLFFSLLFPLPFFFEDDDIDDDVKDQKLVSLLLCLVRYIYISDNSDNDHGRQTSYYYWLYKSFFE